MSKPGLGRGLGALLGSASKLAPSAPAEATLAGPPRSPEIAIRIRLEDIQPSPLQPRRNFGEESLKELAESIREKGLMQPLLVRRSGDHFELIAGERRWRAARMAGLSEVPAIERAATDREVLELALIENLQRENLNAMEEARGYQQLMDQFELLQEDVARKMGKSRASIANALRLLKLPIRVQSAVSEGRLSVGHAKVILGLADVHSMERATDRILAQGFSVRQAEELVARLNRPAETNRDAGQNESSPSRDPHVSDLENRLCQQLGSKVNLRYRHGKGALEVRFYSDDELERLLELLGVSPD